MSASEGTIDVVQAHRPRLLVVDDETEILEIFRELFAPMPVDAVFCVTGTEALAAMDAGGVDVLLTDKNLPDIGGIELIERARAVTPDVMPIVFTAYASLETALSAMKHQAFDYIVKPPRSIFDVQRRVEQALERQALGRENQRLLSELTRRNLELQDALHEVRQMQDELIQTEKLAGIGTLAAGIAHEVSSPLFGVMGLAEAIQDEEDLGLIRAHASEIVQYARNIKDIVVGLGSYTRKTHEGDEQIRDVSDVVHDAVRLVTRSLGHPESVVALELEGPVALRARAAELQQILVNLVKNAIEATAELGPLVEGSVCVRTRCEGESLILEVEDAGPGIPDDVRHEIFDPFFTTKPPGKGTGLGLNIVYRLVTRYRGSISAARREEGGERFTVRLPLAD